MGEPFLLCEQEWFSKCAFLSISTQRFRAFLWLLGWDPSRQPLSPTQDELLKVAAFPP
jgi:hypothetical protein